VFVQNTLYLNRKRGGWCLVLKGVFGGGGGGVALEAVDSGSTNKP